MDQVVLRGKSHLLSGALVCLANRTGGYQDLALTVLLDHSQVTLDRVLEEEGVRMAATDALLVE